VRQVLAATPIVWVLTMMAIFAIVVGIAGASPETQTREMFTGPDAPLSQLISLAIIVAALSLRYALARGAKSWPPIAHTLTAVSPGLFLMLLVIATDGPKGGDHIPQVAGMALSMLAFTACIHFVPTLLATKKPA
jgi:hypothetical protein